MKVCLHNHTYKSKYSINRLEDFKEALDKGKVDKIAITDHNYLREAQKIQKKLGDDKVILGEEVSTKEGEIIGLFLRQFVPTGLSASRTAQLIKSQGGIVYIPHPFDKKDGLSEETLDEIKDNVDVIEIYNGWRYRSLARPFINIKLNEKAIKWAEENDKLKASSTDSHYPANIGNCYTEMEDFSTVDEFLKSLAKADSYQKNKNKINLQSIRTFVKGFFKKDLLKFIG